MKVFVVIVTYNGEQWLRQCMQSVYASAIPLHVIVVDNNSKDNTLAILTEFRSITILQQPFNLGFGKANNIGISYAFEQNADYVFLLNQDAYLEPNTIEKLIIINEKYREFGILSPIHYNGNGTELDHNFSNYIQKNKKFLYDAIRNDYTQTVYNVPFVNAAGWLIHKSIFQIIGGFDPLFFHYGEDVNYCQRLVYHGFKIGFVPKCILFHDRSSREFEKESSIKDQLVKFERALKIKCANINNDYKPIIAVYIKTLKRNVLKSFIFLNFKQLKFNYLKLKIVIDLEYNIKKSRSLNVKRGSHYLDLVNE